MGESGIPGYLPDTATHTDRVVNPAILIFENRQTIFHSHLSIHISIYQNIYDE